MALPAPAGALVRDEERWLRFAAPRRVIACAVPAEVPAALRAVEAAVEEEGLWAVGLLAYEAAAAYGLPVRPPALDGLPLLWFGLHAPPGEGDLPADDRTFSAGPWIPDLGPEAYAARVEAVRALIAEGQTYQANLTFTLRAPFAGDPWSLFARLWRAQRGAFAACLDLGPRVVACASPELFFAREGQTLLVRPMKGTAPRGPDPARDELRARGLAASAKDRAENLMIVDMLRNDLGRVAEVGTVAVSRMFEVERYPTLLQMTSTVRARSRAPLAAIMEALFPCASITGAPKRRTMQALAELEASPRGVYTGAVGWLAPGGRARFAVAIRTAVVDRAAGAVSFGVGSGVVWDSTAEGEHAECQLKARMLSEPPFALLETLRFEPGPGYALLAEHLARLRSSAAHFLVRLDEGAVAAALEQAVRGRPEAARVRLLVDLDGQARAEADPLPPVAAGPRRVALAREPVDPEDPWLHHKTTRREPYEQARAGRPDAEDVVLWNTRGEATESTRANLVVDLGDGALVTPPLHCGLLAGTLRARLLAEGRVRERVVTVEELRRAPRLWLVNSLRGWEAARLLAG